jgi:hypothetical protein
MKIGVVGPSYVQRSLPWNAQRSVNLYPVADESGAEVSAMYGTPGLSLFATAGAGPHRGAFRSAKDRAFFVSDSTLYEAFSDETVTSRGSLLTNSGRVSLAEGLTQLLICDGEKLYSFTYDTNSFVIVSGGGLPASVGFVTNIDGYFVVTENNTGRFYISDINDGLTWNPLDFATAESNPDILIAAINGIGQLWLMGEISTEIWTNNGAAAFPFARVGNVVMQAGLLARHSVIEIDNSIMFVGRDKFGSGIVYRANGFTPQRVSTTPIEKIIQAAPNPSEIFGFAYQQEGHLFYILSGGGLETSLAYDLTTQQWHERAYTNEEGVFEQHLAACHIFAFDKHLVGDRRNGKIYEMSLDFYDDAGDEIVAERTYTHITEERERIRYNSLEIGFETGVGLQTGQGVNPIVSLQVSKDGARTWSDWFDASIGAIGEYQKTVKFRRLGIAEIMTFKIRISDPVKRAIIGSYLR